MSRSDAYTRTAVVLHWLVAALVLAQFIWGWVMQSIPKHPVGLRADAFNLHKSVGLVILALMLLRLGWRLAHPAPPFPPMPPWQARIARSTHVLIYIALFTMPLAGYLGSVWSGYPVKWFGIVLPSWMPRNDALKDAMSTLHLCTSFVLGTAVLLHVAGALRHALARDGVMGRMLLARPYRSDEFRPGVSAAKAP